MATTYNSNSDYITGYISNVSSEHKKNKYFVKFTLISENDETIDGWVFSRFSGILASELGIDLTNSFKNKTGIKLWGSMDNKNGASTFRMQSWSKYQSMNLNYHIATTLNNIVSIKDALIKNDFNNIRASIININVPENYTSQEIMKTSTFILIGDETTTSYLMAIDSLADTLEVEKTFDITQVRKKLFNGSFILTTTINTNISLSDTTITPNLDQVTQTMTLNLSDRKQITTTINEVGEIKRLYNCSTCHGDLSQVPNAAALLYCERCHRHILKANVNQHISTTLVLKNDEEKIILSVNDQILHQLLNIIGVTMNTDDTDIVLSLMSFGSLTFEYSELRRELLGIMQ
ncbi:unnamed protein product [Rotaria magnacalcarata]|uniref:Uncharacterized protein n=1 Tax=Rotaria magnacalcarata TaxID=392030 RepID=A0A815YBU4_9BILA|nr:unnamed protein product [Rotaria magnacalcarata]CAF4241081.1 unnamed protein product [Rotaria magnacalcarata]